jgi:hypothetical protein
LIAGIGEDALDEGKQATVSLVEDQSRAVAILDVGGMNDDLQEKAERVDENMPTGVLRSRFDGTSLHTSVKNADPT